MSRQRTANNNIRAGAFLIVAVIAAFAIVVVLAGLREKLEPRDPYIVRFDIATGATGLEAGSIVRIGGVEVGRVTKVELVTEASQERTPGVYATIGVDKDRQFFGTPVAFLERPLLGAGAELNFASLGDEQAAPLPVGGQIVGAIAPPSFLSGLGYGDKQVSELQRIMANTDEFTGNIKDLTGDAKARSKQWFDDADRIITNFRTSSDEFPAITDNVKQRLDEVKEFIAKARAVLDDNRPSIDNIIANTQDASEHLKELLASLNTETKESLNAMLEDGRAAVGDAKAALGRVSDLITEQTPNLRRSLANTRLASDQLKMTLEELRASPWRLLYRPDTRELEFEFLYDAARTYAAAVSDLRSASEALQAVSAMSNADPTQVAELLESVTAAFNAYEGAEKRFLELVTEQAAPAGQ